ncbi:DUF58 domain-containing protein [Halorientalis salina]|uniref:DUF58 domain-containing protein n=1 Tax=Halorientalis salina TaxID=2932266 RepID=UPI0010AB7197|nr:DUF58 domain-containing protein [Halorientalis salina]
MTTVRRTHHWRGVVAVALLAGAFGVLLKRPYVLLAACLGVGYAIYPRLLEPPAVELALDRRVSETNPSPGDEVSVEVAVTNEGEETLRDLRLVDGVPAMLAVSEGSARHAAVLRPGQTTTFAYAVTAEHGSHQFRAATAIARDVSGRTEVETTLESDTADIECRREIPDPPVAETSDPFPGQILTSGEGEGIEFARTREYRSGDSPNRIDWKQYARTGTLATVEYRQERTVSVVVCIDARPSAYRGIEGGPHAVSHGVAAAQELLEAVWEVDERAGLAAIGRDFCWVPPDRGTDHERRVREVLLTHPTLSPQPPENPESDYDRAAAQVRELRTGLDRETQLVIVSPLADEFVVESALELADAGRPVTVVSPDVSTTESPGSRIAAVERRNRLYALRRGGVSVVDWDTQDSLARALLGAKRRWSR